MSGRDPADGDDIRREAARWLAENPDGEEMTCEGAKTRATELAQSKGIQDVIILNG